MSETNIVHVPEDRLPDLVNAAYELSAPQGLGHLHYQPGSLTDGEVEEILAAFRDDPRIAVHMDYVKGRAVKLVVRRDEDGIPFFRGDYWPDHDSEHLEALIARVTA